MNVQVKVEGKGLPQRSLRGRRVSGGKLRILVWRASEFRRRKALASSRDRRGRGVGDIWGSGDRFEKVGRGGKWNLWMKR